MTRGQCELDCPKRTLCGCPTNVPWPFRLHFVLYEAVLPTLEEQARVAGSDAPGDRQKVGGWGLVSRQSGT